MTAAEDGFTGEMVELRRHYGSRIRAMLTVLRPVRDRAALGALSTDDRDLIARKAHQFAGAGASYGFPGLTDAGRLLDYFLIDQPHALPGDILPLFDRFLRAAHTAATGSESGAPLQPEPAR